MSLSSQLLVSSILYLLGSLHAPTLLLRKLEKFTMAVSKVIPSQTKSSEKADQNYLSSWLSALLLNSLEEPSHPFPLFYPSFHTQLFSKLCKYDTFTLYLENFLQIYQERKFNREKNKLQLTRESDLCQLRLKERTM